MKSNVSKMDVAPSPSHSLPRTSHRTPCTTTAGEERNFCRTTENLALVDNLKKRILQDPVKMGKLQKGVTFLIIPNRGERPREVQDLLDAIVKEHRPGTWKKILKIKNSEERKKALKEATKGILRNASSQARHEALGGEQGTLGHLNHAKKMEECIAEQAQRITSAMAWIAKHIDPILGKSELTRGGEMLGKLSESFAVAVNGAHHVS